MSEKPWLVDKTNIIREWMKLKAAKELINGWEPDWKPLDDLPRTVYAKLDKMELLGYFLKNYKEKLDGQIS